MAEVVVTDDGGITTVDHKVLHARWPCVHHDAAISCEDAIAEAARLAKAGRSLGQLKVARVLDAETGGCLPH